MLDVSGHFRKYRDELGFEDYSKPFLINCCGYQKFTTEDFSRHRLNGRKDYQLIYIHEGCGYYIKRQKTLKYEAGSLIFYRPEEPQIYSYFAKDTPEVYWVHFTGSECENIISRYHLMDCRMESSIQLKALFQEIILELQLQKPYFEDIINSTFIKIIASVQRSLSLTEKASINNFAIDHLIISLNQHYTRDWTIQSMADFCNLSTDYFSHIFKEVTHTTPMNFLTKLRIDKSKELLLAESMSISNVAFLVGYSDPLYFSRVFKKREGVSPKQYRTAVLALQTPFSTK